MKRKCRFTEEETQIHEKAVKLRKMTDQQLVEYCDNLKRSAQNASGVTESTTSSTTGKDTRSIERLLKMLADGKCKGIKGASVYKIAMFCKEQGLIS